MGLIYRLWFAIVFIFGLIMLTAGLPLSIVVWLFTGFFIPNAMWEYAVEGMSYHSY